MSVMVVWLHGSEGCPDEAERAERKAGWERRVACWVEPCIEYETDARRLPTREALAAEARHVQEQVSAAVEAARQDATVADLPTIYAGASRGGYAAIYAAQRDPRARYVVAAAPCMLRESKLWPGQIATLVPAQRNVLAEKAGSNPPGVWLCGKVDDFQPERSAVQAHKLAGGNQDLRLLNCGHRVSWEEVTRPAIFEGIRRVTRAGADSAPPGVAASACGEFPRAAVAPPAGYDPGTATGGATCGACGAPRESTAADYGYGGARVGTAWSTCAPPSATGSFGTSDGEGRQGG